MVVAVYSSIAFLKVRTSGASYKGCTFDRNLRNAIGLYTTTTVYTHGLYILHILKIRPFPKTRVQSNIKVFHIWTHIYIYIYMYIYMQPHMKYFDV